MKTKSLPLVYLNAESLSERETLAQLLSPYSWANGEHGMMLTGVALAKCVEENEAIVSYSLRKSLQFALTETNRTGAGDVCLNML
jgi:hypothetical protein